MIARFNNVSTIYSVFEILKDLKVDVNMRFSKNSIEINEICADKTTTFTFKIDGDKLPYYKYDNNIKIVGINTSYLCTILKLIEKDNIMEFVINGGLKNKLFIKSKNENNLKQTEAEIDLNDPEFTESSSYIFNSGVYITMRTDEFYKTINQFNTFSETAIKFICTDKLFTIEGGGHNIKTKQEYIYNPDGQEDGIKIQILGDNNLINGKTLCSSKYSIDNILKFKKCTKLGSPKIEIRISDKNLLFLSHDVGNFGKLETFITPVIERVKEEEEDNEEINYNSRKESDLFDDESEEDEDSDYF